MLYWLCKRIELKQETEIYREQRPPSCESMYPNHLYKPSCFLSVVFAFATTQSPDYTAKNKCKAIKRKKYHIKIDIW